MAYKKTPSRPRGYCFSTRTTDEAVASSTLQDAVACILMSGDQHEVCEDELMKHL